MEESHGMGGGLGLARASQAMPENFRQWLQEMGRGRGPQFGSGSSSTLTDALWPDACKSPISMRSPSFPVAFIFKAPPPTQAPEGLPGGDTACAP